MTLTRGVERVKRVPPWRVRVVTHDFYDAPRALYQFPSFAFAAAAQRGEPSAAASDAAARGRMMRVNRWRHLYLLWWAVSFALVYLIAWLPLLASAIGYGDSNQKPPLVHVGLLVLGTPFMHFAGELERHTKGILSDTQLMFTLVALNGAVAGVVLGSAVSIFNVLRRRYRRAMPPVPRGESAV